MARGGGVRRARRPRGGAALGAPRRRAFVRAGALGHGPAARDAGDAREDVRSRVSPRLFAGAERPLRGGARPLRGLGPPGSSARRRPAALVRRERAFLAIDVARPVRRGPRDRRADAGGHRSDRRRPRAILDLHPARPHPACPRRLSRRARARASRQGVLAWHPIDRGHRPGLPATARVESLGGDEPGDARRIRRGRLGSGGARAGPRRSLGGPPRAPHGRRLPGCVRVRPRRRGARNVASRVRGRAGPPVGHDQHAASDRLVPRGGARARGTLA